jgi:hypothetical protein
VQRVACHSGAGIESLRQWTRTEAITEGPPLSAPLERLAARRLAFPYDARLPGPPLRKFTAS